MNDNQKSPLIKLVYFSEAITPLDNLDVEMILKGAREKNHDHHVSGMLVFCNSFFLQCLEGPRAEVNEIFDAIHSDARHFNMNIVEVSEIQKRQFPDWDMDYIGDVLMKKLDLDLDLPELEEYEQFYPPHLSAETLEKILVHMRKLKTS